MILNFFTVIDKIAQWINLSYHKKAENQESTKDNAHKKNLRSNIFVQMLLSYHSHEIELNTLYI